MSETFTNAVGVEVDVDELAGRYNGALRNLFNAMREMNCSDSRWVATEPWCRDDVNDLQKLAAQMIRQKREELALLDAAWAEYVEVVDDRGFEAKWKFVQDEYAKRKAERTAG